MVKYRIVIEFEAVADSSTAAKTLAGTLHATVEGKGWRGVDTEVFGPPPRMEFVSLKKFGACQ